MPEQLISREEAKDYTDRIMEEYAESAGDDFEYHSCNFMGLFGRCGDGIASVSGIEPGKFTVYLFDLEDRGREGEFIEEMGHYFEATGHEIEVKGDVSNPSYSAEIKVNYDPRVGDGEVQYCSLGALEEIQALNDRELTK